MKNKTASLLQRFESRTVGDQTSKCASALQYDSSEENVFLKKLRRSMSQIREQLAGTGDRWMAAANSFFFVSVDPRPPPVAGNGGRRSSGGGFFRPSPVIFSGREPAFGSLSNDDLHYQESLIRGVRALLSPKRSSRGTITTVDNLKRLCIDHYFQEEIKRAVDACMDLIHTDDLLDATLSLRLMREAGYHVSADEVLRKFANGHGDFNLTHEKDIKGLLSLQDMSHLNMGEASLYKAKEFSSKHLRSAIKYLEPNFARYVMQSLDHPYHVSLPQYKARHHLSYLQSLPTRNTAMEKLALAEFQLNKLLHQSEMQEVQRWWKDLGLAQEIPAARDQVLKWYMWTMTVVQDFSLSGYRVEITKIISLIYIVDDIFDLVATHEELSLFNEAFKMWDLTSTNSLPTYMISCYKAFYTVTNDFADIVQKDHGLNPIDHLRKAWATLFDGFMVETKWLSSNLVPTSGDYLRNGIVTSGAPLVLQFIFYMLGQDLTEVHRDQIPRIISCPAKIMRLMDDMGSAKDEAQEGLDGSYKELYMRENPHDNAEEHMLKMVAGEWEELNRECFSKSLSLQVNVFP